MARGDPAWEAFAASLRRRLGPTRGSHTSLAQRLGMQPTELADWLRLRSRPALRDLGRVARALGISTDELLADMGILDPPVEPDDPTRLSLLVLELRQRLAEQAGAGQSTAAASDLARAALQTGRWAVAHWPAFEGPADVRIHSSDRLSFRLLPPAKAEPSDAYQLLLEDIGSDLSRMPAVEYHPRVTPGWPSDRHDDELHFSILHHTAPRRPRRVTAAGALNCLLVCSLTRRAWAHNVASLIAQSISYGFASTDRLVDVHYGRLEDLWLRIGRREQFLGEMLRNPPERYVWTHFAPGVAGRPDPLAEGQGLKPASGCAVVYLRESDDAIEDAYGDEFSKEVWKQLRRRRELWDDAIGSLPEPWHQVIDIEPIGVGRPTLERRDLLMERNLRIAANVVRTLSVLTGIKPYQLAADSPLERWIVSRGERAYELDPAAW